MPSPLFLTIKKRKLPCNKILSVLGDIMIIITIITLIVAIALLLTKISPLQFSRLTAITFSFSLFLSFVALYTESLGSGIRIPNLDFSLIRTDIPLSLEDFMTYFMDYLKPILQPIPVNYSNEVLADQINALAILLFLLSLIVIFLFVVFTINAIILIYREKLVNYFSNKYIRAYLKLNTSLIVLELFFLSTTIVYFLYTLSKGLQFIAQHPIIFSS